MPRCLDLNGINGPYPPHFTVHEIAVPISPAPNDKSRETPPAPSDSKLENSKGFSFLLTLCCFAALALVVMYWRWGGTIEDSLHYFNTALFIRGEAPHNVLQAPFPYRILVPAMAAGIPGDVRQNFALLNWLFVAISATFLTLTALRLGYAQKYAAAAGLMLVLSVPTYWYAPYLLVDPGSVCARVVFVFAIISGQPWLALLAGLIGTAIREENILLLVWLLASRRVAWSVCLLTLVAAAVWILAVRFWLVTGLPSYTWVPSLARVMEALNDVRSLMSIALAAGFVLPLAIMGMRHAPQPLQALKWLLVVMALPSLYATLCVRVDGRMIWGLYPFLIPFAVDFLSRLGNMKDTPVLYSK